MLSPKMFTAGWLRKGVICALCVGLLLLPAAPFPPSGLVERGRGLLPAVGVKLAQVVTSLPRDGGRTRLVRAW